MMSIGERLKAYKSLIFLVLVLAVVFGGLAYLVGQQDLSQQKILQWFSQYAYSPALVYSAISLFMLASSFGLPIPEELVLVSSGLLAHTAMSPHLYGGAEVVEGNAINVYTLALVCFAAVFCSDMLVFTLGKYSGQKIVHSNFFKKHIGEKVFLKINSWFERYGLWACGIFRFTPGLRFPGHLSCGMMKVPVTTFILVDGGAALLSVPTQVLLVAHIGETVLDSISQFKKYLGITLLVALIVYLVVNRKKFFSPAPPTEK